jgi:rare lipoprotein A
MVSIMRIACGLGRARTGALALSLGGLLGACAGLGPGEPAATRFTYPQASAALRSQSPELAHAAPRTNSTTGGRYKVGAPYQAGGLWYVPAEQPNYDEIGLASWYGDAFDGRPTANGEIFDMHAVSAAHATLPMPCMVEVTNLENGRTMVVRLNDRGPYHPGRIIDLSKAGAEQLGFALKGTARVRVRYVGPAPLDGGDPARRFAVAPRIQPFLTASGPAPVYPIGPAQAPQAFSPGPQAPILSPAPSGGYVVQAGAYSTRAAAERAASRLNSAGVASVRPVDRGGVTLYRVLLGPWSDKDAAANARGRVASLGFEDARLSPGS